MEHSKIETCDLKSNQLAELQELLGKLEQIFVSPIPPPRAHDRTIPLLSDAKPTNIRPYHYGPLQKIEIEKVVQELLDLGFIRPSHSPFSCPVLLVKKKEGSWRLCMDYRELNYITIKDKYPIHLIDDLLDELNSKFFSKLNLRSGYHQILMHFAYIAKTAFWTHP